MRDASEGKGKGLSSLSRNSVLCRRQINLAKAKEGDEKKSWAAFPCLLETFLMNTLLKAPLKARLELPILIF